MNNRFFIYSLIFFLFLAGLNVKPACSQKMGPDIQFKEEEFDFGQVPQGQKATHLYKFKNEGQSTLVLGKVVASCGCTAAAASKKEIPPRDHGEITVTFDSANRSGRVAKTVKVHSNDPDTPVVTLRITGEILTEVSVEPNALNFGQIERGKTIANSLKVIFNSKHPLEVIGIDSSSELITAKTLTTTKEETTIQVTIDKDAPGGRVFGWVTIRTNSQINPEVKVMVVADIPRDIMAVPGMER